MARRETSADTGTGIAVPEITDTDVKDRFKLPDNDYEKLSLMCKMALKEAMTISDSGAGASNLYFVTGTTYDGDRDELMIVARSGPDAIRKYMQYYEFEWDTEFDSDPIAYHLPGNAPMGVLRWTSLPQTTLQSVEP